MVTLTTLLRTRSTSAQAPLPFLAKVFQPFQNRAIPAKEIAFIRGLNNLESGTYTILIRCFDIATKLINKPHNI